MVCTLHYEFNMPFLSESKLNLVLFYRYHSCLHKWRRRFGYFQCCVKNEDHTSQQRCFCKYSNVNILLNIAVGSFYCKVWDIFTRSKIIINIKIISYITNHTLCIFFTVFKCILSYSIVKVGIIICIMW